MQKQFDFKKIIELVHETKKIVADSLLCLDIQEKGASDYVTAVDINISAFLKERLNAMYPDIGFMCEEEDNLPIKENRWILDPIDGTTNLIFDYQLSSVSLALHLNDNIVFGIVYNPFTDETFYAEKGNGAYLNGKPLSVSTRKISESLVEFSAGSRHKEDADYSFNIAKEVFLDCVDVRCISSSALSISYIAAKRIDGFFEKVLNPWDYAAASIIIEEAGGIITDFSGKKLQFDRPSSIIAANVGNHAYLVTKIGVSETQREKDEIQRLKYSSAG